MIPFRTPDRLTGDRYSTASGCAADLLRTLGFEYADRGAFGGYSFLRISSDATCDARCHRAVAESAVRETV